MTSASRSAPSIRIGVFIDDVGLHSGVTEAALALCQAGRVSALSCMSEAPSWRDAAATLVPALRGKVDFGLHLTFTEPWSGSRMKRPVRALVTAAYARAPNGSAGDYLARWGQWCARAAEGDLLMCHPAAQGTGLDDPIASARTVEYRVLRDERVDVMLAERGVSVVRLSRRGAADLHEGAN